MKFKTIAKRFAVAALAGVLAVSSMGISAAAAGVISKADTESSITTIPVTKYVLTDGNTYKPNTTFTYSVSIGDANPSTYSDDNNTNLVVYQGVTNGLKFVDAGATVSAPSTSDTLSSSYTITGGYLTVDASVFNTTGIYHYVVTEVKGNYEGISYDTAEYDVYLFVYQDSTSGNYYVGNVVTSVNGTKTDLSFTNNYGDTTKPTDPDDPDKNDTTHDITVTKSVTGSMGDKTKDFKFTVSVTGTAGEIYKVAYKTTSSSTETVTYVYSSNTTESGVITSQDISIKNTGSITVYGLSESDEVKIVEASYASDGYTTTYKYSDNSDATALSVNGVTVVGDGTAVTVENNKDTTTPTGIALTIAPYVLMVALAAVVAVVFLRKRSYEA